MAASRKKLLTEIRAAAKQKSIPVLGITGTGGAGKSSLTDELIRRFRAHSSEPKIAILAIDPSRRKTGGALLGDRIRMNTISAPSIYFRSLATRSSTGEVPEFLADIIATYKTCDFDLIVIETPGIGQGDAGIVPYSDLSLYVMTPEFGAATQLEKIDMFDYADAIAINKFDRRGAEDALRDVSKQYQRNHEIFDRAPDQMPVFGTIAARFADEGATALYQHLLKVIEEKGFTPFPCDIPHLDTRASKPGNAIVPPARSRYLAEIADTVPRLSQDNRRAGHHRPRTSTITRGHQIIGDDANEASALKKELAKREEALDSRAKKITGDVAKRQRELFR